MTLTHDPRRRAKPKVDRSTRPKRKLRKRPALRGTPYGEQKRALKPPPPPPQAPHARQQMQMGEEELELLKSTAFQIRLRGEQMREEMGEEVHDETSWDEPVDQDQQEVDKLRDETKERIAKGGEAVGQIKGRVEDQQKKLQEQNDEGDNDDATPTKKGGGLLGKIKSFFQGLGKKKEPKKPPVPSRAPYDYTAGAGLLDSLSTNLRQKATELGSDDTKGGSPIEQRAQIETEALPEIEGEVAETADKLFGKVERRHINEVSDVGTGIRHGIPAMITQALQRGGIKYDSLNVGAKIGKGGSDAFIYEANYLGMAPMAYKLSRGKGITEGDTYDPEKDDVVKEQRLMRELDEPDSGAPNLLRSGDLTKRGDNPGYAMELAKHGDLEGLIKKMEEQNLTPDQRLTVMRHLMQGGYQGLEKVHDAGLVHADVKDANFLVGEDQRLRLMDFGFTEKEGHTGSWSGRGTGPYMAPETVKGDPVQKSDIWAMAETLMIGVFGSDSVDIFSGKGSGSSDFNKEKKRSGYGEAQWEKEWKGKLETKTQQLKQSHGFKQFLLRSTRWKPKDRMTVKEALDDKFLALTKGDQAEAQRLLKLLLR